MSYAGAVFYVAVAFTIEIPWRQVLVGTIAPTVSLNYDYLLLVVAVLGTTKVPICFSGRPPRKSRKCKANGHGLDYL
jgi:Mn2+/Fe2+ NRAMP family transporter